MAEDIPGTPTSSGTLAPGTRLGSRYTIRERIGRGGTGEVYQAWDDEAGGAVAIRTITFHAETDAAARNDIERRFKRDVLLAKEIAHPNVARIHDIGDVDGSPYVVMALVSGVTLSAYLQQHGSLSVSETLRLGRQIAEGLAAAHQLGVVHRNLRPENVMVAEGSAIIMDLGMARSNATETGFGGITGTVEYMAPEQSRGSGVDARADIYAWGLMVYDMLTGRKRVQGHDSPMAELLFRMKNTPPPLGKIVPGLPAAIEDVVNKATHPNPERRFGDGAQLLAALRSIPDEGSPPARRSWWPRWR